MKRNVGQISSNGSSKKNGEFSDLQIPYYENFEYSATFSGLYSLDYIRRICELWFCYVGEEIGEDKSRIWCPFGNEVNEETSGMKIRVFRPIFPVNIRKETSAPNGTYGFVIPIVILASSTKEGELWCFGALKTSMDFPAFVQEATKTLHFGNTSNAANIYPSINLIDAFSVSKTENCEHCKLNEAIISQLKPKSEEGTVDVSELFSSAEYLNMFMNDRKLRGIPPPPSWWFFWFSLIRYSSDRGYSGIKDYFRNLVRSSYFVATYCLNGETTVSGDKFEVFWDNVTLILDKK